MANIRPATISDVEALVRVHHAAVHGPGPSTFYTQSILQSWSLSSTDQPRLNRLQQAIQNNEKLILVAELGEKAMIVGYGCVVPSKKELRALYVDPTFGHQRIGSQILRSLEDLALHHSAEELYLDASLNAEKFYCRHGYLMIERDIHRLNSGIDMDCIKMHKKLRSQQ